VQHGRIEVVHVDAVLYDIETKLVGLAETHARAARTLLSAGGP
jgi:hypothetical protein